MIDLTAKRALVTGAGQRVGAEIALALGQRGAHVAVHYHASEEGAEAVCDAIRAAGGEAEALRADLSSAAAAAALPGRVLERLGGLDILVAGAANFERVAVDDIERGHWDRALALNLTAPFALAHAARDALRSAGGSITFITGFGRRAPYRNYLPYLVSKGGVYQLMRALALELAPEVRVNAVAPGTVLPPADMTEAQVAKLVEKIPLGRVGSAADVAAAVVYLSEAAAVTGEELVVDGGRVLHAP
jgi:pteridine reductase